MPQQQSFLNRIITRDPQMLRIFDDIKGLATSPMSVLITGETGVGKEFIAKAIHQESQLAGKLVVVNAAGLDDAHFSDTLFGHRQGAYTGADQPRSGLVEQANGGTLFLDEIGDLLPISQTKLLRFLQEGEYLPLGAEKTKKVAVRTIAATNRDLWTMQKKGTFRQDLNYRLRGHHVHIPPLRERPGDLPLLTNHFLTEAAAQMNKKKPAVPKELSTLLSNYSFPGNVRELKHMVTDAVSRQNSSTLSLRSFKESMTQASMGSTTHRRAAALDTILESASANGFPTLKEASAFLVQEAMRRTDNNISQAAVLLGISRQALSKRLKNSHPSA